MSTEDRSTAIKKELADPKGYKRADRITYAGIGVYSLVNVIWIVWAISGAGFGIFNSASFIEILVPIVGILTLVLFQCSSPQNRFSALANVLSIIAVGGWFFLVW
ncbi:MAG: hypothetical protein ACPGVU_10935, partial [Limisphaerales bacterium]